MKTLFDLFFDICLLRRGPQDLPTSVGLLRLTALVYAIVALALASVGSEMGRATAQVLIDIALTMLFVQLVLRWKGHAERFVQTLTAMFGASAILTALGLPLLFWLRRYVDDQGMVGAGGDLPSFLWFVLFMWSLLVTGHILRNALQMRLGAAVLLAGAYTFGSISITGMLLPSAAG
ncbi:MAG: hypothetical protein H6981_13250 [Gammaproteobacteria bacterium]|nr:hypothetical protein [Gammaproteobacteria bacterium]MCP5137756.1 hypothetical protein [Gammaproteobacteria bacterium]